MDKYLVVGLGNVGSEYEMTRHNTGFMVLDAFAKASNIVFDDRRYGFVAETSLKGRKVILLKPSTFMNLSGNAVRYWLNKENIDQSRLLVVSDDVALPLGAFLKTLQPSIDTAVEIIKSFVLAGIDVTMNQFNKRGRGSMSRNEEGGKRNELEEGGTRKEEGK